MRFIGIALLSLFLGSCVAGTRGNPDTFRVGEVEVRLYQEREKMLKDLPEIFKLVEATRVGDKQIRVLGYFDRQNKRIYSVDDARVVIHEFKHYLEPNWRHRIGVSYLEGLPVKIEEACAECDVCALQEDLYNPDFFDLSREGEAVKEIAEDSGGDS